MEDILDATFYQDDFLTRTLTTSVLYDKSQLDLTFADNNNTDGINKNFDIDKNEKHEIQDHDSPNLDFLKLGSPDLEQMLFNINENNDSNFPTDEDSLTATNFGIEDDLVKNENCFTDALQQLHDKQTSLPDLSILDSIPPVKPEKRPKLNLNKKLKPDNMSTSHQSNRCKSSRAVTKQHVNNLANNMSSRNIYNNNILNNVSSQANFQKNFPQRNMSTIPTNHHSNITQTIPLNPTQISDQIVLNNQLAILNGINQDLNVQQMQQQQQQQQQQEIAFLTQAMGYHSERDSMQSHLINGAGFPQHVNQVTNQLQQKMMEQQLLQHQMNGFPMNNPSQLGQISSKGAMGIDEQTLKMFMDNPHLAPINLEIQELIKRERKKLRNRIASSKCRKRKLEREGKLEDRVKDLKEKNIELNAVANALKQQICDLKQRVMDHVGEGCQIMLPS